MIGQYLRIIALIWVDSLLKRKSLPYTARALNRAPAVFQRPLDHARICAIYSNPRLPCDIQHDKRQFGYVASDYLAHPPLCLRPRSL